MDYSMTCANIIPIISALLELMSVVLAVVAALTVVTTLIVEVVKGLFPKVPTNFVAAGTAQLVTFAAMAVLCAVMQISIMWCYVVGAVVLGFFVAYAAMFGFDKFKDAVRKLKEYKNLIK